MVVRGRGAAFALSPVLLGKGHPCRVWQGGCREALLSGPPADVAEGGHQVRFPTFELIKRSGEKTTRPETCPASRGAFSFGAIVIARRQAPESWGICAARSRAHQ